MHPVKKFLLFCIAGTGGLLVDVGVLYLTKGLIGPFAGRVVSFTAAVATTFVFNHRVTFSHQIRQGSWWHAFWHYFVAMLGGGLVNYATYAALIVTQPWVAANPAIGVAAGSIVGLAVNYLAANNIVFRADPRAKD